MEKIVLVVDPEQLKQIIAETFDEKLNDLLNRNYSQKPETPPPEWMNTKEVSELCRYTQSYIYELVRKNKIPCDRTGRSLRFLRKDIEAWIKANRPSIMQLAIQQLKM